MAATSRYLLPPILKITRPFFRMSALRNISLISVGFDQSAPRTMGTQALRGCSASSRPGLFHNVRKVLTAGAGRSCDEPAEQPAPARREGQHGIAQAAGLALVCPGKSGRKIRMGRRAWR